nr:MAG TPA: hypothetical protein [Caudoviricetes sp.]
MSICMVLTVLNYFKRLPLFITNRDRLLLL